MDSPPGGIEVRKSEKPYDDQIADQTANPNKNPKVVLDLPTVKGPPKVLATDTTTPTQTNIDPKKVNNKKQKAQTSGDKIPVKFAGAVYALQSSLERKEVPATIAGQYSDFLIVDKKEVDQVLQIKGAYKFQKIPNILGKRKQMREIEAKLNAIVNYSDINIIKDQVAINLNDVNETRLSDLSFNEQKEVLGQPIKFEAPKEQQWQRTVREQKFNNAFNISRIRTAFPMTSHNNVRLIRKSIAVSKYVDNLFNTTFGQEDRRPLQPNRGNQQIISPI